MFVSKGSGSELRISEFRGFLDERNEKGRGESTDSRFLFHPSSLEIV